MALADTDLELLVDSAGSLRVDFVHDAVGHQHSDDENADYDTARSLLATKYEKDDSDACQYSLTDVDGQRNKDSAGYFNAVEISHSTVKSK